MLIGKMEWTDSLLRAEQVMEFLIEELSQSDITVHRRSYVNGREHGYWIEVMAGRGEGLIRNEMLHLAFSEDRVGGDVVVYWSTRPCASLRVFEEGLTEEEFKGRKHFDDPQRAAEYIHGVVEGFCDRMRMVGVVASPTELAKAVEFPGNEAKLRAAKASGSSVSFQYKNQKGMLTTKVVKPRDIFKSHKSGMVMKALDVRLGEERTFLLDSIKSEVVDG